MKTNKQLEFDFMKSDLEKLLESITEDDLKSILDEVKVSDGLKVMPIKFGPAHNPCSSCPNFNQGPCHCTVPHFNRNL